MTTTNGILTDAANIREMGLDTLLFARHVTTGLLEDVPGDQWLFQPFPSANHATWIVGHIALNDDNFLTGLGDRPSSVPAEWKTLFGAGSTLARDKASYPQPAELMAHFNDRRTDLLHWFRQLPADQLTATVPEAWQRFGASYAHIMNSLAWHEGLHAGQLTTIRRGLGLGAKFG